MATTRPLWRGSITFGLVSFPCQLAGLERPDEELDFSMLDRRDQKRIRYKRVNDATGEEVPWKEIVKGHELPSGKFVVVTPDDFKRAAPKATRTIEITDFVARDEIDPWFFVRPYLLVPASEGAKVYDLLTAALRDSGRVGVASIVMNSRQHLAAVIPGGEGLVLNILRYAAELKPAALTPVPKHAPKVGKKEVELARMLIDQMSGHWKPEQYHDEYRDKLRKWVAQRAKHPTKAARVEDDVEEVEAGPFNIMDLLKKSIETKAKPRRSAAHKTTRRRKAG